MRSKPIEDDRELNYLSIELSTYGSNVAKFDIPGTTQLDSPISFRYGSPALDRFPFQIWRKLFSRHCGSNLDLLGYSSDSMGHQSLREALCNYLKTVRAVNCQPEQILITNGSQQAIDLVTRVLVAI